MAQLLAEGEANSTSKNRVVKRGKKMTKGSKHAQVATTPPDCEPCQQPMAKAGAAWSGTRRVQRWRCGGCGKTTIKGAFKSKPRVKPEPRVEPQEEGTTVNWIEGERKSNGS